MYGYNDYRNYLAHYGVKGMKWGVRRYQKYKEHSKIGGKALKRIIDLDKERKKAFRKEYIQYKKSLIDNKKLLKKGEINQNQYTKNKDSINQSHESNRMEIHYVLLY